MRFIFDGPDFPNRLIIKWLEGEVVFLAGAGVSVPSNMPLFDGLALKVYEHLNDGLLSTLDEAKKISSASRRTKFLDGVELSSAMRVEANLFLDRQFDVLFSAIERRIDRDIKGRPKSRKVREAVDAILKGNNFTQGHQDLVRLSLSPPEDRSKAAPCRIATTNFDLLLEEAWRKELGREAVSFDARIAPRPGAHNFEGIIHLHGMLSEEARRPTDYVLSSWDFARVYLRSGVIGNYVYELIRRYTLVLVGYSADDPPMRYLMDAIGEDTSLFSDMNRPYAIVDVKSDIGDPATELEREVWQATKEIIPIFYKRRNQAPFAPLWESLNSWANWAREETAWVEQQLACHTHSPRAKATSFDLAFVEGLLSLLRPDELEKAVEFLSKRKPDFGWVETLNVAIDRTKKPVDEE